MDHNLCLDVSSCKVGFTADGGGAYCLPSPAKLVLCMCVEKTATRTFTYLVKGPF